MTALKRLVLHDLEDDLAKKVLLKGEERTLFPALPRVAFCCGCFGCWVKTPGACVIKDRGASFVPLLAAHQELTIVSRLLFGCFSPEVKAVLDRSIGYLLPYFKLDGGASVHLKRHSGKLSLTVLFYGPASSAAIELANKIAQANAVNLGAQSLQVNFFPNSEAVLLS
jgi:multimeric flavodoxin WrbA